jgi:hypothetical protein
VVIKVKLIVIELRKMKNIQVELTYFKEQQEALNESIKVFKFGRFYKF